MSVQKATELIKAMSQDEAFRKSVVEAPTREAKHEILESRGFGDVSPEDLQAVTPSLGAELSEEELEAVAGGDSASWVQATAEAVSAVVAAVALAL